MRIRDPLITIASVLLALAVGLFITTSWTLRRAPIDAEEDKYLRAVLVGMLPEAERYR